MKIKNKTVKECPVDMVPLTFKGDTFFVSKDWHDQLTEADIGRKVSFEFLDHSIVKFINERDKNFQKYDDEALEAWYHDAYPLSEDEIARFTEGRESAFNELLCFLRENTPGGLQADQTGEANENP